MKKRITNPMKRPRNCKFRGTRIIGLKILKLHLGIANPEEPAEEHYFSNPFTFSKNNPST